MVDFPVGVLIALIGILDKVENKIPFSICASEFEFEQSKVRASSLYVDCRRAAKRKSNNKWNYIYFRVQVNLAQPAKIRFAFDEMNFADKCV